MIKYDYYLRCPNSVVDPFSSSTARYCQPALRRIYKKSVFFFMSAISIQRTNCTKHNEKHCFSYFNSNKSKYMYIIFCVTDCVKCSLVIIFNWNIVPWKSITEMKKKWWFNLIKFLIFRDSMVIRNISAELPRAMKKKKKLPSTCYSENAIEKRKKLYIK